MTSSLQEKQQGNKKFYYVVLSYKKANNKWTTKWVSTHIEVKSGNKKIAKAMMASIMEEYKYLETLPQNNHDNLINKDILFCDYVEHYLEHERLKVKTKRLEQSTFEGYVCRVNHILRYFRPLNKRLIDITPKDINDFIEYELQYGKENPITHELTPLSIRSVRSDKSILYSIMSKAMMDGLITKDPTQGIKVGIHSNAYYANDESFLDANEAKEFLKFVKHNDENFYCVVLLGLIYGLRRSEMLGLKWQHIDFDKKRISIENVRVRVKSTYEKAPKTKSSKRRLTLVSNVEEELLKLKSRQEKDALEWGNQYNKNDYVLKWQDGHLFTSDYLSKHFKRLAKSYGREELTLHRLRHSCCSMLALDFNMKLKEIQMWLGHSDMSTTSNIYMHAKNERHLMELEPLNQILNNL